MKTKYFLIGFIFLNIIVLSSVALGKEDFDTDVKVGSDIIWVCNVLDDKAMKDIFEAEDWLERDVPDWDDYGFWEDIEQGSRMRWYILHAKDESTYMTWDEMNAQDIGIDCVRLKFKLWKWTDDTEWDDKPDYEKARAYMHADPEDIGSDLQFLMPYDYGHDVLKPDPSTPTGFTGTSKDNIFYDRYREYEDIDDHEFSGNFYKDLDDINDELTKGIAEPDFLYPSWGLPMWIPQDVDDYLDDMKFNERRYNVDDKDRTISARIKEQSFDFFDIDSPSGVDLEEQITYELPNEDIKWKATYNEQGFLANFKLWNNGGDLVCEFTLQMLTIPGYEIHVMLGFMGVSIIAVIYIVMKKRQ